jgi:general L-amino acid transport system substrate-binding protein
MPLRAFLLLLALLGLAAPALAEGRLADIKARGGVRCAAIPRPGLAMETNGGWRGLYLDICRAVAVATAGPAARVEFHELETPQEREALRRGDYDMVFLSATEMAAAKVMDAIQPGPPVYFATQTLMVESSSAARIPEDLAGASICFSQARGGEAALEERFDKKNLAFVHMPFEEDVELVDAYNARHCSALAGEATELAKMRLQKGVNRFDSRLLAEPLSIFPILAATPTQDAQWTRVVAWAIAVLQAAERPETKWRTGGANALAAPGAALGLDGAWRETMLAAVGDYGAIYARNLGEGSPFKLARGPNAPWSAGGLLAPPTLD